MKRLVSLVTVLVLLMTAFSACKKAGMTEEDLKKMLVEENKLVLVAKTDFPPYVMDIGDGTPDGIDVEIAREIASRLGLELEVKNLDDTDCTDPLTAVQTGWADIAMGAISADGEQVSFSEPYATADFVVMVVDGSPIKSKDDLELVEKISAAKDTSLFASCSTKCGAERMVGCADDAEAIAQLTGGKVQCAMVSESAALEACENDASLIMCEDRFEYEAKDKEGKAVKRSAVALVKEEKYNSLSLVVNGYLIGTTDGTACGQYCKTTYGDKRVVSYTNGATVMQALLTGKVDCAILDNEPAKMYQKASEHLVILSGACSQTSYSIGVSKSNPALDKRINEILKEMQENGTIDAIVEKYIPKEAAKTTSAKTTEKP